jgi:hypothetical protein
MIPDQSSEIDIKGSLDDFIGEKLKTTSYENKSLSEKVSDELEILDFHHFMVNIEITRIKKVQKLLNEKFFLEFENFQFHHSMVKSKVTQIKMLLHHLKKQEKK